VKIAYVAAAQIPSTRANSIQVMKVCQALKQNGQEIRLYVPGRLPTRWDVLKKQYGLSTSFDIEWISNWRILKYLDFTFKSLQAVRQWRADIVYTRMLQVARSAALSGLPVILELHNVPSGRFGPSRLRDFLCTPVHKRVVFITRSLRQLVEEQLELEIPDEEVIIGPDGVDLERYETCLHLEMPEGNWDSPNGLQPCIAAAFTRGGGCRRCTTWQLPFPTCNLCGWAELRMR